MKTKILTIYPKTELDKKGASIGLPLSILHVVSSLNKDCYEFFFIDQRVDENWSEKLENLLAQHNFLCVGISTMTGAQIDWGLRAAKIIRKSSPTTKIVFGGVHPTIYPTQTVKHSLVDVVIRGDGELAFPELVEALKNNTSLSKIKGLSFIENNEVIDTGMADLVNLDNFPEPDYSLININNYFLNLYHTKKALSLVAGRGCPHRCAFCYNPLFNKQKWRCLSVEKMIERIKKLADFGAQSIDIIDDNFFTNLGRAKEFCRRIKEEKINLNFVTNCRADYIVRFDEDFLKMLYDTGFKEFYIGIESGSQKILNLIKKDITLEQVIICNQKLQKCGIVPIYSFITGFPNENFQDTQKTINLMMRLLEENPSISLTSLKVYTPFPGSEFFQECVRQGLKVPNSFDEWRHFTYNSSAYEWRSKKANKLLKKLSYITYFLDQKTMSKHLVENKPLLKFLIKSYSKLIWYRCKYGFYYFTPEVYLMDKLKKFV